MRRYLVAPFFLMTLLGCDAPKPPELASGSTADRIVIVKSQGWLTAYNGDDELVTYFNIQLGEPSSKSAQLNGNEMIPVGNFSIERGTRDARRPCKLDITPVRSAERDGTYGETTHQELEIVGEVPLGGPSIRNNTQLNQKLNGKIGITFAEMQQLCAIVPNGIPISIRP